MSVALISARLAANLPVILFTVTAVIGIAVAYRFLRDAREDDEPMSGADLLPDLEQAYYSGKMNEAEFHRVRDLLVGAKGKSSKKVPPKPPRVEPERAPSTSQRLDEPAPDEPDGSVSPPDSLPHPG